MALRVAVCGLLSVVRDGAELTGPEIGTRKARLLVTVLAASRGATVSADRLAQVLWGEQQPRDPHANLATLASRLRRTLGDGVLVGTGSGYALAAPVVLDLDDARDLVASARIRLDRGEPALAVAAASRALASLGADDGLAEECSGEWAVDLVRDAADLRREARHVLARAADATGEHDVAHRCAADAAATDPFDERAHRDLMTALVGVGRTTAALDVYATLAARLADELGTDPDEETRRLHLTVLRGSRIDTGETARRPPFTTSLVDRDHEVERLDRAWSAAASTGVQLVLLTGVPGIGKTRLLTEVAQVVGADGGVTLSARCHPDERSLFLQPFVEALRPVLLALPDERLRAVVHDHEEAWTWLVPDLRSLLGPAPPGLSMSPELARRRAYDAVSATLTALADEHPILLAIDDLQHAASASVDLLGYLARHLHGAPVLLLGALRSEASRRLARLLALGEVLPLAVLRSDAVEQLATAAGQHEHAADVRRRTRGHPLSVVESLKALAAGSSTGVPASLAGAVAGQLGALSLEDRRTAEAASVLGSRVDPVDLSALLEVPELVVVDRCQRLAQAGLLRSAGTAYEFSNDLIADAVRVTVADPLAAAFHRLAADVLADRPEEMAGHALASGDRLRAARGWLAAGRTARHRAAFEDAVALLDLALDTADESALRAAIRLERSRAHEALTGFDAAFADADAALVDARDAGELRFEMRALQMRGGDAAIALGRPVGEATSDNAEGLALAARLGDRVAASRFRTRLVILGSSRLQFVEAEELALRGVAEARSVGSPEALARSLDGLKSVYAFTGDVDRLEVVITELRPILVDLRLVWLLQWTVLESSLLAAARGEWARALSRVDEALALNRESGYSAYAGFFRAQRAWLGRMAGDLDGALVDGRTALQESSAADHPWWYAAAAGGYAATLLEAGAPDEAAEVAAGGLAVLRGEAGAAYRLRCLAPLAAATGQRVAEADALLAGADTRAGTAWITGSDVYDAVAAAWHGLGEPDRARSVLAPLIAATGPDRWAAIHRRARQRSSASS